jgi:hypothetical protein
VIVDKEPIPGPTTMAWMEDNLGSSCQDELGSSKIEAISYRKWGAVNIWDVLCPNRPDRAAGPKKKGGALDRFPALTLTCPWWQLSRN